MKSAFPLLTMLSTASAFTLVSHAQLPPPAQPKAHTQAQPKAPEKAAHSAAPRTPPAAIVLPQSAPESAAAGPLPSDDVLIIVPGGEAQIPPARALSNASVGGVKLAGLNEVQAALLVRRTFASLLEKTVALWDGRSAHTLSRRELGASIPAEELVQRARSRNGDVPVTFKLDRVRAMLILSRLAAKIEASGAENSEKIEVAQDGSLQRVVALIERDEEVRPEGAQAGWSYVTLVLTRKKIEAPVTKPELDAPRNFPYLIGSFSTKYDASLAGRTKNLRMAAANINGTVVKAGGIFSTNRAIGPRNAGAGWREAKMFVSGKIVSGVGAGICQSSTTIYNAALLAGFPIVERHQHTFRVMYAPASRDAAIAWGQKDFQFRNDSGGAILVKTAVSGGKFHAQIYGEKAVPLRVAVESSILSRKGGTRSTAWRTITDDSGTRRETLSRDFYRPHP